MSVLTDIADAVASHLNAGAFSLAFTAQRAYRPVHDLEDLQTLRVSVVPKGQEISTASRSAGFFDMAVDIAVQQKVAQGDVSSIDPLMTLVQEIVDYLRQQQLPGYPAAKWLSIENKPVYDPDHLLSHSVFTSLITVRYREQR